MSALPEPRPWSRAARTAPYSPSQTTNATVTRLSPSRPASVSLVAVDGEQALLVQDQTVVRDLTNVRTLPTGTAVTPARAASSSTGTAAESGLCSKRHVLPFTLTWGVVVLLVHAGIRFGLLPDATDIAAIGAMVGWALYIEVRNEH